MKKLTIVFALAVVAALAGGVATSAPGGGNDPDDSDGTLDISSFAHDDTETEITYTLNTYEGFDADDVTSITWNLDFTPDDQNDDTDACLEVTPDGSGGLDGRLLDECGDTEVTTATVTHTDGATQLTVAYDRSALDSANDDNTVTSYSYRIEAVDSADNTDEAPDAGEPKTLHELGAAQEEPTPTPDPDATPTPDPEATPTPEPTEIPLDTPTPDPVDTSGTASTFGTGGGSGSGSGGLPRSGVSIAAYVIGGLALAFIGRTLVGVERVMRWRRGNR